MSYFLSGILLWYCIIFVFKTKTGSPSVMSKDEHIKRLLKYIKPGMRVADMGCGDGGALIRMVEAGAEQAEGWEIEPGVWIAAQLKIRARKMQDKVRVQFGDMWKSDLSRYDLVYVYQLTRYAPRFAKKCKQEMKKGAIVIANTYPIAGLGIAKQDGKLMIYQL